MFARVYISNCMGHYYMYMYLSEANCMVNIYKTCLLMYIYISNCMGHYYMYMYLSEANCMVNIYTTCLLVYIYLIAWVIIIYICT